MLVYELQYSILRLCSMSRFVGTESAVATSRLDKLISRKLTGRLTHWRSSS